MSKRKVRKQRPQPPKWFNWDCDNCWFCDKDKNTCGGCKILKRVNADENEKQKHRPKDNEQIM